jgi:hypothetical protein
MVASLEQMDRKGEPIWQVNQKRRRLNSKEERAMRPISLRALAVIILLLADMAFAGTPNRVTILYDSFGISPSLTMDVRIVPTATRVLRPGATDRGSVGTG